MGQEIRKERRKQKKPNYQFEKTHSENADLYSKYDEMSDPLVWEVIESLPHSPYINESDLGSNEDNDEFYSLVIILFSK